MFDMINKCLLLSLGCRLNDKPTKIKITFVSEDGINCIGVSFFKKSYKE